MYAKEIQSNKRTCTFLHFPKGQGVEDSTLHTRRRQGQIEGRMSLLFLLCQPSNANQILPLYGTAGPGRH